MRIGTQMIVVAALSLSIIPSFPLSAQVGHDPAQSPFHDIPLKSGPVVFVGHLSGDRGRVDAGMSNALTFGGRYEFPSGRALLFQLAVAYLSGDRFIIDPRADSTSPQRRTGPFKSDLLLTEVGAQLRLTGAKSWRGIVPYVGFGLGLMYDLNSPGDTTFSSSTGNRFEFGTKFTLSGATGIRWFPTRRVMFNADLRGQMWRLRYPSSFVIPAPDGSLLVEIGHTTDWTLHPWISLGVGWTF